MSWQLASAGVDGALRFWEVDRLPGADQAPLAVRGEGQAVDVARLARELEARHGLAPVQITQPHGVVVAGR